MAGYIELIDKYRIVPVVVNAKPKPITNADAVRAMTDEELAYFLNEIEAEAIKRA